MADFLRKITALLPGRYSKYISTRYLAFYIRNFLLVFFLFTAAILIQVLSFMYTRYEMSKSVAQVRMHEYEYWSSVVNQFPNIPDILYNAALSSYNAGKKEEALRNLEKALLIDPLFKKAKILQNEINEG